MHTDVVVLRVNREKHNGSEISKLEFGMRTP